MIAYRIIINGKRATMMGQEDTSILHAGLIMSQGNQKRNVDDYIELTLGGMSHETAAGYSEHFRWKEKPLQVGDRVEIEIVETDEVDPPIKRYRSDRVVQEDPLTEEEIQALKYKSYLKLKEEFGD